MVRKILPFLFLLASSSFQSNNKIFTAARPLPTPNLPLTQQTLHHPTPQPTQNPTQKLCGLPLLYLYPCDWTTSPSISPLGKLPPVIFVKYIFNIPGTLLDSIFTPLGALGEQKREGHYTRSSVLDRDGKEAGNGIGKGNSNVPSHKRSLQLPFQSKLKQQLLSLELETQETEAQEQNFWSYCGMAPFFIFPCRTEIPDQDILCTGGGNKTELVNKVVDGLKASVPGVWELPKL
ncbi:hypothetical protein BKA65DRAFT_129490 [Rhexocercosporidium sp. MPI-PUGE-AT-0058]|nr:hypothetical protein BKA65DRAFT_129490 [Rhexocercosporidium sp. MPI-PUGE-AT-0058]